MAKVTIGDYQYDVLAGIPDASQYLAADVARAAPWALLTVPAQGRALVSATRLLLGAPWCGNVPDPTAAQPPAIIAATAMLAADMGAKPRLQANPGGASNVKMAKAGSAQVEFFAATTATANPLPDEIWRVLLAAGLVGCTSTVDDTPNDAPFVSGVSCGGCGPCGSSAVLCDDDDRRAGGWC